MNISEHLDNFEKLAEEGEGACFFGKPVSEMGREELLAMIGFLGRQKLSERAERDRQSKFLEGLASRVEG